MPKISLQKLLDQTVRELQNQLNSRSWRDEHCVASSLNDRWHVRLTAQSVDMIARIEVAPAMPSWLNRDDLTTAEAAIYAVLGSVPMKNSEIAAATAKGPKEYANSKYLVEVLSKLHDRGLTSRHVRGTLAYGK